MGHTHGVIRGVSLRRLDDLAIIQDLDLQGTVGFLFLDVGCEDAHPRETLASKVLQGYSR
jgi:hypothetical protein